MTLDEFVDYGIKWLEARCAGQWHPFIIEEKMADCWEASEKLGCLEETTGRPITVLQLLFDEKLKPIVVANKMYDSMTMVYEKE